MADTLLVSKTGFYKWLNPKMNSSKGKEETILLEKIKNIHAESEGSYGYIRVTKQLKKDGEHHNKKKIARIMRFSSLFGIKKLQFKPQTTIVDPNAIFSPNLVNQNFQVEAPDQIWVSDITFITTKKGFVYLCVILDLYSRKIVGWSLDHHMKTSLLTNAFFKAYNDRNPSSNLIFHSDRGSQYTSKKFRKILKQLKIKQSMSRTGNCFDNACAESFFSSLKTEKIYREPVYASYEKARIAVFKYIETFYNRRRLHSYLDHYSPEEFELKKSA